MCARHRVSIECSIHCQIEFFLVSYGLKEQDSVSPIMFT